MPQTYLYKARDNTGKILTGQMEADDERLVVLRLREQGCMVLSIVKEEIKENVLDRFQFSGGVSAKDLAIFCRQFATMLNAGVPLINCLSILQEQTESKAFQKIIADVSREIEGGSTLTRAFGKYPQVFPVLFTSLIQVGETTGTIDNILERLAGYYEKDYELREKIKSAMAYPTLVVIMAFGVVIFLVTFILPIFEGIFESMNIELPIITKALLLFSHFIKVYWFVPLVGLGLAFYAFRTYARTEVGSISLDRLKMMIPVFGALGKKLSFSRFNMSLAIMVASGVPMLQALEVARDTLNNKILVREVEAMQDNVRGGGSISAFLDKNKNFPVMMSKMIAVGETTGALDVMLNKIADFYEKEVQFMVDRLASLLEPFLIAFLGVVVGGIVLSIMLPMMNLIGSIGG